MEPNAAFARGEKWISPFSIYGEDADEPRLFGLTRYVVSMFLCPFVVARFHELAQEAGSTATWRPEESKVLGHAFVDADNHIRRVCGTTNTQLLAWRRQAVAEVLDAVEGKKNAISGRVWAILEKE